ncbi:hypothetical protein E2C01_027131 [Portunus trituberculatus]|uniref:Uncharacterized protein n=1 Tax=Portunus trituberculatus TaxID=210409 RepID=A0A5B7EH39_PORTR|nr:hypothetical protein [Portunus trituberculatus]
MVEMRFSEYLTQLQYYLSISAVQQGFRMVIIQWDGGLALFHTGWTDQAFSLHLPLRLQQRLASDIGKCNLHGHVCEVQYCFAFLEIVHPQEVLLFVSHIDKQGPVLPSDSSCGQHWSLQLCATVYDTTQLLFNCPRSATAAMVSACRNMRFC